MNHTEAIRSKARQLLQNGEVACVIGYEVSPRGRTRPTFVHKPADVDRLVWNAACTHNLANYLPTRLKAKKPGATVSPVAVVAKPCDGRAINVLLAENQFERDKVHVLGVVCPGIVEGAGFKVVGLKDGGEPPRLQARCQRCTERNPIVFDTRIGEPIENLGAPAAAEDELQRLEALTPAQRAEYWLSQFDRCIRCYACRQACPMCYCANCLFERDDSLFVGMGIRLDEKRTFQLGRAFHLAGRCVGCDECERVCPMDLPISLLNRRLAHEMQAAFGHRAGMAPVPGPLLTVLGSGEGQP